MTSTASKPDKANLRARVVQAQRARQGLSREEQRGPDGRWESGGEATTAAPAGGPTSEMLSSIMGNPALMSGKPGAATAWAAQSDAHFDYESAARGWSGSHEAANSIRSVLNGSHTDNENVKEAAATLSHALDVAPPIGVELYRGLNVSPEIAAGFKEGESFQVGPSSFTTDREHANGYATGTFSTTDSTQLSGTPVLIQTESGTRGAPIMGLARANEHEVISAGKFTILKLENVAGTVVVRVRQEAA